MSAIIPRKDLPPAYRIHDARAKKKSKARYPAWFMNERVHTRVLAVATDYYNCCTLPEIMGKYGISMKQIYIDIDHARELQKINLQEEIEAVVERAVARRTKIMRDADREIESIQAEFNATPQRGNAVANLLRVKAEQQTKVEEILALRGRSGQVESLDGSPLEMPSDGKVVIFDMRTQTLNAGQTSSDSIEGQVYLPDQRGSEGMGSPEN